MLQILTMTSLGFDVGHFRMVQQMKKSNLYLYSLENKAALPYHECAIEINSNLYLPDQHDNLLGLVSKIDTLEHQKGVERVEEFARYGCLFKIHKADVKGGYLIFERTKVFTVTYTGITFARFKILSLTRHDAKVYANVEIFADQLLRETENALEKKGLVANFKKEMKIFYQCKMRPTDADALKAKLDLEKSVNKMIYRCAEEISLPTADKLKFLQIHRHEARLEYLISVLTEKTENLKNVVDIEDNVRQEMQKSLALRKIRPATGSSSPVGEVEALSERIKNAKLPSHVREEILKQIKRLGGHESQQAVTLKYIETLLEIPWLESTEDVKEILQAERMLQSEHTGLKDVKERILQFLSVRFRNGNCKGNVICLHGPPGVGKTSIAKSIAKALGKQFTRVSLGGMNDEAELRGHRRTYVAALPGVIVRALIKAKSNNPVILLDEIQKMGASYKGNPEHALLEILDPSQNSSFVDHYVSIPVDLSKVLFICTANSLQLSGPLINRLELIEVPGYSREEKLQIAQNHLVPMQKKDNGVEDLLQFETQALQEVIRYCNQLGVRELERKIAKICRKAAREGKRIKVTKEHVEAILGKRYEAELWRGVGVANGMAWTQLGGKVLTIEAIQYKTGTPKIEVTGQLGDVMKESVKIALSWLRANLEDLVQIVGYAAVPSEVLEKISLHLHFPEGATKKDGPSAGVTIVACIASLLLKTPVRENLAMTGEITLSGRVLPVGGVREKCIAAIYSGIKHIIIPAHNLKDVQKMDSKLRKGVQFYPVKHIREVLMVVFPELLKEAAPKI